MKYYEAKFLREKKDNPTVWIVVADKNGECRLKKIGLTSDDEADYSPHNLRGELSNRRRNDALAPRDRNASTLFPDLRRDYASLWSDYWDGVSGDRR